MGPVTPAYLCILVRIIASILIKVATNHQILAMYTRAYWLGLLLFRIRGRCCDYGCVCLRLKSDLQLLHCGNRKKSLNASQESMIFFGTWDATTTRMNYCSPFLCCMWEDMVVIPHRAAATLRSQTFPMVPPMQLVVIKRRCKSFGYGWPSQFTTCYDRELL